MKTKKIIEKIRENQEKQYKLEQKQYRLEQEMGSLVAEKLDRYMEVLYTHLSAVEARYAELAKIVIEWRESKANVQWTLTSDDDFIRVQFDVSDRDVRSFIFPIQYLTNEWSFRRLEDKLKRIEEVHLEQG